jgi:hypothetical protein
MHSSVFESCLIVFLARGFRGQDTTRLAQAVSNYQDVMPDLEPVSFEDDDRASRDDEPDDPASFGVDMSAIGQVH